MAHSRASTLFKEKTGRYPRTDKDGEEAERDAVIMPKYDKHCNKCVHAPTCGIYLEITRFMKKTVKKIDETLGKYSAIKKDGPRPANDSTVYNYMYQSMKVLLPTICANYAIK